MIALVLLALPLAACETQELYQNGFVKEAQVTDRTRAGALLETLPPASEKIAVSLYDFQDMTGQFKYNDKYSDFSSAVTKGGLSILTKALLDAGNKKWFTVTERGGLKDLLQERQIIKVMRSEYRTPDGEKLPDLPPLLYGGMLLQGGIIGYDSNVITGGAGALYLGIGGNTRYARDIVTVYLRAVSVQTGEVLLSVTSAKTIYSTSVGANVLKYITFDRLLQAEAGFSLNEPVQLATRQAIETAVYSLIMEGALEGLWDFKEPMAGQQAVQAYLARRDGPQTPPDENDPQLFAKAMANEEVNAPRMPEPRYMAHPPAVPAPMQPVASHNLPPPVMAEPEYAPAAGPQRQAAVMQPAPQWPTAEEPVQVVVMPPAEEAPVAGDRPFQPQLQPEAGPVSQAQPQQQQQFASARPPVQEGAGSVSGWGYNAAEPDNSGRGYSSVSYTPSDAAPVSRQRPMENTRALYYY